MLRTYSLNKIDTFEYSLKILVLKISINPKNRIEGICVLQIHHMIPHCSIQISK